MIITAIYHHYNCHIVTVVINTTVVTHVVGVWKKKDNTQQQTRQTSSSCSCQSIKNITKRTERGKERIREEEASCTGILLVSKKKKRKKRKKSITRYTQEPCKTKAKVKRARAYHQKHRDSKGRVSRNLKRRSGRKEGFWKRTV